MTNIELIQTLNQQKHLTFEQWTQLIGTFTEREQAYAADLARRFHWPALATRFSFAASSNLPTTAKTTVFTAASEGAAAPAATA